MSEPFKGTINIDIRDSVPDWSPFEPPKAPDGAPNVVYIVLDDVGFSAMSCYGGPIETPNIDRIANDGIRYTQWHTTALCSPTRSCLLTGRNHTRNSMACITEAAVGFPNASGTIPPENGMISEILGERGWNTYIVGKWHLCPTVEMNIASTRRNWPSGRGFERFYGFLGAETNQWYPDLIYDNHPVDQPKAAPAGLPPDRGPHGQGDRVHQGRQRRSCRTSRSSCTTRPAPPTRRTMSPGNGPTSSEAASTWAMRRSGSRPWPGRSKWASSRPIPSCRPSTRSARGRPATDPTASRSPRWTTPGRWESLSAEEKRLFARMAEVYAGFLAHADHHIGRLLDYLEESGQRDNTMIIVVSDNGASGEGGPNGSVNEMKVTNGIPDDMQSNLAMLDELGGTRTYNHYPNGWAMVFNTPFKMWKRYEFNGGTADPCIIPGLRPRALTSRGELRDQYHHAIDIVPTILDVLACRPGHHQGSRAEPLRRREHALQPDASAPPARKTQSTRCSARAVSGTTAGRPSPPIPRSAARPLQRRHLGAVPHRPSTGPSCTTWPPNDPTSSEELVNLWFAEAGQTRRMTARWSGSAHWRSSPPRRHSWPAPATR